MNCQDCGAPLDVGAAHRYFFCAYCGTSVFPHANQEVVRLLEQAPDGLSCPACHAALNRALLDGWQVDACGNCRGLLVEQVTFGKLTSARRARATDPPNRLQPVNPRDLHRRVGCPTCTRRMSTHPCYGPGNIVIDNCAGCGVLWLDIGELSQVVEEPGRDRGDFHLILQDL